MASFMGDDRFQREVGRIGIALESVSADDEQVGVWPVADAILPSSSSAENMPVFNTANEAQPPRDLCDSERSRTFFCGRYLLWLVLSMHAIRLRVGKPKGKHEYRDPYNVTTTERSQTH